MIIIMLLLLFFSLRIQVDAKIHLLTFKVTFEVSGGRVIMVVAGD